MYDFISEEHEMLIEKLKEGNILEFNLSEILIVKVLLDTVLGSNLKNQFSDKNIRFMMNLKQKIENHLNHI